MSLFGALTKRCKRRFPKFAFEVFSPENANEYARARLADINNVRNILFDRATAMENSLVASLILLDAGAALANLGPAAHRHYSGNLAWLFLSGILIALLNGRLIRLQIAHQLRFLLRASIYWSGVAADGRRIQSEEKALWHLRRKASWQALAIPVPALLSVAVYAWAFATLMATYPTIYR